MAEYVRRRRPPADHPYWERLRDRAHPPPVVLPIVIAATLGAAFGLFGGLKADFTIADALKLATTVASGVAGVMMSVLLPLWIVDSWNRGSRWERVVTIGAGAVAIAMTVFFMAFIPFFLVFLAYSVCSGRGAWLGLLIGLLMTTVPTVPVVWAQRTRWAARQRAWPRWNKMRPARRRQQPNNGAQATSPTEAPVAAEGASTAESPISIRPIAENIEPQVGESSERV